MGALFALFGSDELKDFELKWDEIKASHPADAAVYERCGEYEKMLREMVDEMENYNQCGELIKTAMAAGTETEEGKAATHAALVELCQRASMLLKWMRNCELIGKFMADELLLQLGSRIKKEDTGLDKSPAGGPVSSDEEKKTSAMTLSPAAGASASAAGSESDGSGKSDDITPLSVLTHQALSKKCVILLELLCAFDQAKQKQSQLQNDFAFYKRSLPKLESEDYLADLNGGTVDAAEAGNISMFLAYGVPTMRAVALVIGGSESSTHVLAVISNACYDLLKAKKFAAGNTDHKIVVRAMVASFIMFDYAHPNGAFTRRSATKGTKICSMVQTGYLASYPGSDDAIYGLKNMVVFSSLHYNDDTTVAAIRRTLDAD